MRMERAQRLLEAPKFDDTTLPELLTQSRKKDASEACKILELLLKEEYL